MASAAAAIEQGARLEGRRGRYAIRERLASGGFGVTWLAEREADRGRVVVKELRLDRAGDWKAVELFEREAKVLASLRHANIPEYVDHFESGPEKGPTGLVLVQAYVPGQTLEAVRRSGRRLDPVAMQAWFRRLLEVLDFLHGQSPPVIHRDITPKNVILREADGEPVLIDFGTVQNALRSAQSFASTAAGTFGYAPLEQFVGRATAASDLYSLAVTFLAVASGLEPEAMPFESNRIQVREALRDCPVDARLLMVLEEMTEPDAARRPQRAADVLARLGAVRSAAPAAVARPARPAAPTTPAGGPGPAADSGAAGDPGAREVARLRELAAIAERLGADGCWTLGDLPESGWMSRMAVTDDGRHALLVEGRDAVDVLDLQSWRAQRLPSGDAFVSVDEFIASADGRALIKGKFDDWTLHLWPVVGDARQVPLALGSDRGFDLMGGMGCAVALRPDDRLLAIIGRGGDGAFYDTQTGRQQGQIHIQHDGARLTFINSEQVRFSPDGRHLFVTLGYEGTLVVDADGKTHRHAEARAVAVSPDGRWLAAGLGDRVKVGPIESLVPLRWAGDTRTVEVGRGDIERLRFSPHARFLAVEGDDAALAVVDVATGQIVCDALQVHLPGRRVSDIESVGFSADEGYLLVHGGAPAYPGADPKRDVVTVIALPGGEPRATLAGAGEDAALHVFARGGVWGALAGGSEGQGTARRPKQARRLALGEPIAAVFQGKGAEPATELAERVRFWTMLEASGRLMGGDVRRVIDASRGLAHVLPKAVEQAAMAGGGGRLGDAPAAGQAIPGDRLVAALEQLGRRTPAEREVVLEDLLPVLAEQARQQGKRAQRGGDWERRRTFYRRLRAVALAVTVLLVVLIVAGPFGAEVRLVFLLLVVFLSPVALGLTTRAIRAPAPSAGKPTEGVGEHPYDEMMRWLREK